jgi:hypothetical protein
MKINSGDLSAGISMLVDHGYIRQTGTKYEINPYI